MHSSYDELQDKTDPTPARWTTVIRPVSGWLDLDLKALWQARDLIMMFVHRDFVSIYKQTILGPLWYLIQPVLMTMIFTVVFGYFVKIPTGGLPHVLFYLSGLVIWRYFSECFVKNSNTFVANNHIFSKVYFPRLSVPISIVISNSLSLLIQLGLFVTIWGYFKVHDGQFSVQWQVVFLPLLLVQVAALGVGCGIIVSSLTTKYRDFAQLVGFGVQLWFYATPVLYPAELIPEAWRWLLYANPMSFVVESFRFAFFGVGLVSTGSMVVSVGLTVLLLAVGIVLFSRIEKSFVDTV